MYEVIMQSPDELSESEFGDFLAFVLASGEVISANLEQRVRNAERLALLRVGGCLGGIGALKKPNGNYRRHVASASDICLSVTEYPFELGWIFVLPSFRDKGLGGRIAEALLSVAKGVGVFATARSDNLRMHSVLQKGEFIPMGKPYPSRRGDHKLQVFLRPGCGIGPPRA